MQTLIDKRRQKVLIHLARGVLKSVAEHGPDAAYLKRAYRGIQHLWYHKLPHKDGIDLDHYELRDGNPPSDIDRPKYLRGLDLEIDITKIPDDIMALLVPGGKLDRMIKEGRILDYTDEDDPKLDEFEPEKDFIH